jgi:hypothetical protein
MPDAAPQNSQPAPLSYTDLANSASESVLSDDPQGDLEGALATGARDAEADARIHSAAVLRLLAEACSLMLNGDTPAAPLHRCTIRRLGTKS